ncbi:MAG: hypothetical protein H6741_26395 [Alphaproteobacteria bacterium]|nr:hypothetical protein [Alphaproteobacteria bacterium]MCB9796239.1 hypothetical protein [Alphaproteobacteria bacterium]
MGEQDADHWAQAFEAFREDEAALRALALGLPVRGGGLTIAFEPPTLRGRAVDLRGARVQAVVLPLRLRRGDGPPETLLARVGWWPASVGGRLRVAGRPLDAPERPAALVADLGQRLAPGALSELLRFNLSRTPPGADPDPEALLSGAEGLLDAVSEALLARLEGTLPDEG